MAMKVIIYSTTTCPYCKMAKDYLSSKNVVFEEKLVDQDEVAREEMMKVSGGFLGVPFLVITKDDGSQETVLGFDKGKLDSLLGL
ncbi:MAG: NrdH-redoxin [Patescibacteria group bacterium]|nr:MAG: NrdH-redoxin [Patescibacteria group bacterium]